MYCEKFSMGKKKLTNRKSQWKLSTGISGIQKVKLQINGKEIKKDKYGKAFGLYNNTQYIGIPTKEKYALSMDDLPETDTYEIHVCVKNVADLKDVDDSNLGLKGSPTKIAKASDKVPKGAGEKVNLDPAESVAYLIGKFKEKHII